MNCPKGKGKGGKGNGLNWFENGTNETEPNKNTSDNQTGKAPDAAQITSAPKEKIKAQACSLK